MNTYQNISNLLCSAGFMVMSFGFYRMQKKIDTMEKVIKAMDCFLVGHVSDEMERFERIEERLER